MKQKKAKREILPDSVYNSVAVAKFINQLMKRGKKTIAVKIVYGAFGIIKEKTKKEPLEVFDSAMRNVRPLLEIRPRRIGGATYQVPVQVQDDRGIALAIRWILEASRGKKGKPMKEKLASELIDAANNAGSAIKKRENVHRMAEANRAFAHFAW